MWLTDKQKREIIHNTWFLKKTPMIPFIIEVGPFHAATKEFFDNDIKELEWNENYHKAHKKIDDFNIPNNKPNLGIGIIAAAFGCNYILNNEADPWIKAIITRGNIKDVYSIKKPNLENNKIYRGAYSRIKNLELHSKLPLRLINIPSPLVTASLIWDYTSFIESTLLNKKEIHILLEMITQTTIEFVNIQLNKIKNLFTMGHEPWYIPKDVGIRISDDTAAIMSPDTYKEFGLPYINQISEAFGGLIWHSCGSIEHVLPIVLKIKGLRGIDIVITQNKWNLVRETVKGKVAINLRHYFYDHADQKEDLFQYSKDLINYFGNKGILLMTSTPTFKQAKKLSVKLKDFLLEYK